MKKTAIRIISLFGGAVGGMIGTKTVMQKKLNVAKDYSDKHFSLFPMMKQWVKIKQEGKNLAEYFERNALKRIAVYGIDKNADRIFSTVDVISVDDSFAEVDAVIVTVITYFDDVKGKLSE